MKYIYLLIVASVLWSCSGNEIIVPNDETKFEYPEKDTTKLFGIEKKNFDILTEEVKSGDNLGAILSKQNIDYKLVEKASHMDSVFDIKKIRAGQNIWFFYNKTDSVKPLDYLVYEVSAKSYVIFDFTDSLVMTHHKKPIEMRHRMISGTINSSLWNVIANMGVNTKLAIDLSDVMAWTIDFFDLKQNDQFAIIFDESYIDSTFIEIEKIYCIRFDHDGKTYYAFPNFKNGAVTYYDEKGNSQKKAFLKAPLQFSRISSRFSNGRFHPVLKIMRPHHGVDYAAPMGTPVYSVGAGKVIKKGWDHGGGRYIKIKHNDTYTTVYMHLSKFADINEGDHVAQGQLIGNVGSSGLATGPHLDFRFFKNGKAVDPLKVISPPEAPLNKEDKPAFEQMVKSQKPLLDSLIKANPIAKK